VAQQEAERARYLVEKVSKLVNKTDITAGGWTS
jgi:hypothetical protein